MNNYEVTMEKDGKTKSAAGQLTDDGFTKLVSATGVHAKVNMSVGQSMDYGNLKVSASVTLTCDQNEKQINEAGRLAFYKALELMKDGFSEYGVLAGPDGWTKVGD